MAPPSTSDKWPPPEAYDEIVTIIAGKSLVKIYSIHRGVLIFYSTYFEKALGGGFSEARSKEIKLPDAEPEVMDVVQNWFYSHRLHPEIEQDRNKISWTLAPKVWVFADAHDMPALQNAVIDFTHERIVEQWTLPTGQLPYIYENTMPNACLRRYTSDIVAETGAASVHLNDKGNSNFTKELACDILKVVWGTSHRMKSKAEVRAWDLCKYHIHEAGVKCGKKTV